MKKFLKKYVNKFKEIKERIKPTIIKPQAKVGAQFCDAKELIDNSQLFGNGLNLIDYYETTFNNSNPIWPLIINGNRIDYYYDLKQGFHYLTAFYMAYNMPDKDSRRVYFRRLNDLENTDSYPILPPPNGAFKYAGWLKGKNEIHPNSSPASPACVEVLSDVSMYSNNDLQTARPENSPFNNISTYSKPGFTNVWFNKGFAVAHDLAYLDQTAFPDLTIYDGINGPLWDYREWVHSASEYPDKAGNMQSTTPYAAYSWKDFLFRLKSWAENPSSDSAGGPLQYPWSLTYTPNLQTSVLGWNGVSYTWVPNRYKAFFFGITVDMTPQEVYNHVHTLMDFGNNAYIELPGVPDHPSYNIPPNVAYPGPNPYLPDLIGHHDPAMGFNRHIPWVVGQFQMTSGYQYSLNPNTGLPSGLGVSWNDKRKQLGKISFHNFGAQNCTGCDSGCYWDFKVDKLKCSEFSNYAWPFKDAVDCENYRNLYNELPCPKGVIDPTVVENVQTLDDSNISVFTPSQIPIFKCSADFGNCYQDGVRPFNTPPPPNTFTSFLDCVADCRCSSDCCKKELILNNSGLPNTTGLKENACISHFELSQNMPNTPFPSSSSVTCQICTATNARILVLALERWTAPNLSNSNWHWSSFISAQPGPGSTGISFNVYHSTIYRATLFTGNAKPSYNPPCDLSTGAINHMQSIPAVQGSSRPVCDYITDQAYIRLNVNSTTGVITEIPLTANPLSSNPNFPGCDTASYVQTGPPEPINPNQAG